jgi:transposase
MKTSGKYLTDFQYKLLQRQLQENLPSVYQQRLNIMLLSDSGMNQSQICEQLGCSAATASHWIHIAKVGMAHQWQDCQMGRPKFINEQYVTRLGQLLQSSPRDFEYPFHRWTIKWLAIHLEKELGIALSERHLKRIMKQLNLSTVKKKSTPEVEANNHKIVSHLVISDVDVSAFTEKLNVLDFKFVP